MLRVKNRGEVVAEIPNRALTDEAPVYRRPMATPAYLTEAQQLYLASLGPSPTPARDVRAAAASPTIASKRWVYRQYDHMVRTNTLCCRAWAPVSCASRAPIARWRCRSTATAASATSIRTAAPSWRWPKRRATSPAPAREPIGATNCLNFGNPERPEIMWQFAQAVEGIGEACRALDIPITGGNVSLYNETDGRAFCRRRCLASSASSKTPIRVVAPRFSGTATSSCCLARAAASSAAASI